MGSAGRSLASAASASSRMGTTVWSRYCLVGSPRLGGSSRGRLAAGAGAVVGTVGAPTESPVTPIGSGGFWSVVSADSRKICRLKTCVSHSPRVLP